MNPPQTKLKPPPMLLIWRWICSGDARMKKLGGHCRAKEKRRGPA